MLSIQIPLFRGAPAISVIGPMDIFLKTNEIVSRHTPENEGLFDVKLVAQSKQAVESCTGYPLVPHCCLEEAPKPDLILIPALDVGDPVAALPQNQAYMEWLQEAHAQGVDIASICVGAFLLAEAGLLDGKKATTHWANMLAFENRYPMVKLLPEAVVVDNGQLITCGGATSFLNLCMYLIEKYAGRDIALMASKMFLIDLNKSDQRSYAMLSTQKNHQDSAILKAQELMEVNVAEACSIAELADKVNLSPRTFARRFKAATGNTPKEYQQRVRVEAVKKDLESGQARVEAAIHKVGYEDLAAFRRIFKRETGFSPSAYKKRYKRPRMEAPHSFAKEKI